MTQKTNKPDDKPKEKVEETKPKKRKSSYQHRTL